MGREDALSPGATLVRENFFFFTLISSEDMKRGQKKKRSPMRGSTEDRKKEGSKKMKKLSGGQKEELPWVFFLQQCVVFYEICQQKVITKQRCLLDGQPGQKH